MSGTDTARYAATAGVDATLHSNPDSALLSPADPDPAAVVNPAGRSPFLLVGDHAGNLLPPSLGTMGIASDELARHIGWDIGVGTLGEMLAQALDATFVHQRYSRLVVDCNRDPAAVSAVPPISDGTRIPANEGLSEQQRKARFAAVHEPYHQAIAALLEDRGRRGETTILISLHSFTPALRLRDRDRPWQIGVLYEGGDTSFATSLLEVLRRQGDLIVGENEPYAMTGIDYTVPRHAYAAGLRYAELELRQDLLCQRADLLAWSDRLCGALQRALT